MSPLQLARRRVLVHTLTSAAPQRLTALAESGAAVHVCAAERSPAIEDLASRGLVTLLDVEVADAIDLVDVVVREDAITTTDADAAPPFPPAGMFSPETGDGSANGHLTPGRVTLVGGGPGDPGLLTIAGWQALRCADVVVTDRLAPLGLLAALPGHVEVVHVGKIPRGAFTPQESINATLVEKARAGHHVVRLKGGDNFVFGRGGEEWLACREAGIDVRVIPGVTSAVAAPALAGIPVTHRSVTQGFVVVSAHVAPDDPRSAVDWAALAASGLTLVVLMGVATLPAVAGALVGAGLSAETPCAAVADGGMPTQRSVRSTLRGLDAAMREAEISAPAVVVIGDVVDALDHDGVPDGVGARPADHGCAEGA